MNYSFYSADKATHLKILVVGLAAAVMVSVVGISARVTASDNLALQATGPTVVKATKPVVWTSNDASLVR